MQGALPAGPSAPNSEGALGGIVGSTKIGSAGKSVSGGGGAPARAAEAAGPHDDEAAAAAGAGTSPAADARISCAGRSGGRWLRRSDLRAGQRAGAREDGDAADERPSKLARVAHYNNRRRRLVKFGKVTIAPGRISVNRHGNHLPRRSCRLRANSPVLACDAQTVVDETTVVRRGVGSTEYCWEYGVHCRLPVEPATMFDQSMRARWLGGETRCVGEVVAPFLDFRALRQPC